MRVAIQGLSGSFHHQAVKAWFGNDKPFSIVPSETFTKAFLQLQNNEADIAILAIENSIHGSLTETLDLIERYHHPVVGELYLRIHQQLIGLPGSDLQEIKYVYSQPVALAQCNNYLTASLPNAVPVDYHDTTASVQYVKSQNDPTLAAIAGSDAAKEYGLAILDGDIEDNKQNFTRFLVIDPHGAAPAGANKSSLVLTTTHQPGALAQVLTIIAAAGINLTKLQSRPIASDAWNYRFYIDLEAAGEPLAHVLDEVRKTGATVTVLGEYARGQTY
ncbi:MAG TPA: prephenate dehydratase [Verrucomicrobiae bacterium]|nr:prephenate dehydratase [Verrucomicrobiae bacterium]